MHSTVRAHGATVASILDLPGDVSGPPEPAESCLPSGPCRVSGLEMTLTHPADAVGRVVEDSTSSPARESQDSKQNATSPGQGLVTDR